MRHLCLFVVFVLQAISWANANGYYTVIAPGTLHINSKYTVIAGLYDSSEPVEFKISIHGEDYSDPKTITVPPNEIQRVEFQIPHLKKADYNLTIEGLGTSSFKNTTKLTWDHFKTQTRIQTDKGTYKPGDVVNFRVLFLDKDLKPATPGDEVVIWFEDSKRNRVKQFKHIKTIKGVYTGKFQLSEFPLLGNWHVSVRGEGVQHSSVYIKVDKYVLPKYKISVEPTRRVSVKDGDMQVVVRANYTYGKPVDGKVTLVLELQSYGYYQRVEASSTTPDPEIIIKSADMVQGKAKFDLNVKQYKPHIYGHSSMLNIVATVEELYTGVKINRTASSILYANRYAIACVNYRSCNHFDANKEQEIVLQVLHVDGTPVKDNKSKLRLNYTEKLHKLYHHEADKDLKEPLIKNETLVFETHLNGSSMAVFKVMLPHLEDFEAFSHYYNMQVEFEDEVHELASTYQNRPPKQPTNTESHEESKDYFKLKTFYANSHEYSAHIGEPIIININSSAPLSYVVYNLVGRGDILESKRLIVPDQPKLFNITLTASFQMAPRASIYVHYIDEQGKYISDEYTFSVNVELQNTLEIVAPKEVSPGANVSLTIKTEPHSFVGLIAIDQSVLLLSRNNAISRSEFNWRLSNYRTYTPWQGGYSYYPGTHSGVMTLTNAHYVYNMTFPDRPLPNAPIELSAHGHHSLVAESPKAPGGGSSGSGVSSMRKDVKIRSDFSEIWIFDDIEETQSAEFNWSKKIPDTITSWLVGGFSMHSDKGLGVIKEKTEVVTFQPFFIAIRLPYSVKRGEVINVPALVFNYLEKDLDVEITLENTDNEYEFTEVNNEIINEPKRLQTVRVPAMSSRGASFMIRPKVLGNIMLKFTAISPIAGDAIHKTLKVVPEGITEYANRAYLVTLKNGQEFKEHFELDLPAEVIPDSEHVEFSVIGDLLGPVLKNYERLLRMPTGCGEQTMSTMLPNFLLLKYLKTINKLTPALEYRIKNNLETGYQHLLSFQHDDGSFSLFGPSKDLEKPRNGSTWLTAYIMRSLLQMREFVEIDGVIFHQASQFLLSKQAQNGSFTESLDYFSGSQDRHLKLTANVLLALEGYADLYQLYANHIDKGYKYLLENFEKTENLYAKMLATYALHKQGHPLAKSHLKDLTALAQREDGRMWWSEREQQKLYPTQWWRWVYSRDVEITAYALLMLVDQDAESVLPIVTWLVGQRNSYGGFSSTQDTVVGLQALIAFATKLDYEPGVMDIRVTSQEAQAKEESVQVNEKNDLLQQSVELPHKTKAVDFVAQGKGVALVQIAYQYNVQEKEKKPAFSIETVINENFIPYKLVMEVCVGYGGNKEASNMALLEITLPSGYIADADSFENIKNVPHVRLVETKNSDSLLVIYFDSLPKQEIQCVPVEALRSYAVALQKPASIVLYDYYEPTEKATHYYEVMSKLCDICEDDEQCKQNCQPQSTPTTGI